MLNEDIISMPDKWEYPWYAAWDLAFHSLPLSIVDPDFAKEPAGSDASRVVPAPQAARCPPTSGTSATSTRPVHAFASLFLFAPTRRCAEKLDLDFLRSTVQQAAAELHLVVNRKDRHGKNVFEGGFLGLDNIGVFDRSAPLPTGGHLEQADGTAWMALFSQNMLELAIELTGPRPDLRANGLQVRRALLLHRLRHEPPRRGRHVGRRRRVLLRHPAASRRHRDTPEGALTCGLLPLCATTVIERSQRERIPNAMRFIQERMRRMPELAKSIHPTGPGHLGVADRGILALVNPDRLRRILTAMLDEEEFLGPHGIRSISKFHEKHPYVFHVERPGATGGLPAGRVEHRHVRRQLQLAGPGLDAVNALIIRALQNFYLYYGDNFTIECPTGSGR
jgi:hypothetical protein